MTRAPFAAAVAALLAASLAACVRHPAPAPTPHYVVGAGYQAAGTWFYPHEDFQGDTTGIAAVDPRSGGLTADGERRDPTAMVAAHQTLQLPAILRVTNLETGLQALVRVNDRGPDSPARLIALSPKAAELLGIHGAAPVRLQVEEAASVALRAQLNGGPVLAVATAPRGAVQSESLAPPPGVAQSTRGRTAPAARAASSEAGPGGPAVPDRLAETATHVPTGPVRLMIAAGSFGQAAYARQVAAKLAAIGATVQGRREGRGERFEVQAGPFDGVPAADAALDRALRAGVSDARIVVQ